jgi:transposase
MSRRRYKQGIDRQQGFLLPTRIEEYVGEDNPVRAIDTYLDSLDLNGLGFHHAHGELAPGQPAFPPMALLKLYLYGYLHRVRSSRRLEKECQRNLEVIWLLGGLRPGYKTIANFRKDNLKAIQAVNRDFVQLCKELDLFGRELVAIDGSFFRGNVSKKNIYTSERLKKSLESIEKHIAAYLQEMEQADFEEGEQESQDKVSNLKAKLDKLKERQQQHQARMEKLQASGEKQLAEVDEDARLLNKRSQKAAGYNVQSLVDDKHMLLAGCEVTQDNNDEQQLEPMAKMAKAVLEVEELDVVADAGYFNARQIKNCQEAQITPYVPEPDKTAQVRKQGRFGREAFTYQPETNSYRCPAGKELKYSKTVLKRGKRIFSYRSVASECKQCPLKEQCLPPKTPYRQVSRWEHEAVIEEHRKRMAANGPEMMLKRACLAEHPFGSLKMWCGWTHFLLRGLEKVRTEISLLMLIYNFKRVLNILGLDAFREYCQKRAESISVQAAFGHFLPPVFRIGDLERFNRCDFIFELE